MSASLVKHDKYETGKIKLLFQIIENAFKSEQKQDYEIFVDGYKVVARTNDPEKFNDYTEFINSDSESVTVKLFKGTSASNDKFFFHINGVPKQDGALLGIPEGMTATEWEAKQKEKIMRDIRYDELEKENAALKEDVESKEKAIKELTENVELAKQGKLTSMSDVGTTILMRLLQHPSVQEKFPVLNGFAGAPSETTATNNTEQGATFKRKEDTGNEEEKVTDEERGYMMLIHDLHQRLTPFQLSSVMHILDMLTQYPIAIGSTQKHIHNFLSTKTPE